MTKLIDGRIPAHTPCPFKEACATEDGNHCLHKGVEHAVPFSCGFARAFDLIEARNRKAAVHD